MTEPTVEELKQLLIIAEDRARTAELILQDMAAERGDDPPVPGPKDKMVFYDKSGRVVKVGDFVVWAVSTHYSADMSYGKVTELKEGVMYNKPCPKLQVMEGSKGYYRNEAYAGNKKSLHDQDRVLIVTRSQIPADILAAFDKAWAEFMAVKSTKKVRKKKPFKIGLPE